MMKSCFNFFLPLLTINLLTTLFWLFYFSQAWIIWLIWWISCWNLITYMQVVLNDQMVMCVLKLSAHLMSELHNYTNSWILVLLRRAVNVLDGSWEWTFSSVSPLFNVTSVLYITFNTAPCAVGWTILLHLCQILIPFLILISTLSPWLVVWISNFYVDWKTVQVKDTISRLFDYFKLTCLLIFKCLKFCI